MKEKLRSIFVFSIIFLVIDQVIKIIARSEMVVNQSVILIRNVLHLTLTYNTGAAFSLFDGSRFLLIGIGVVTLLVLLLYIIKVDTIDEIDMFIYSLLFGGIMGNLIDRIIFGYVTDYVSLIFGNYYFPIFNFADFCIVLAIILLIINMIRDELWKER